MVPYGTNPANMDIALTILTFIVLILSVIAHEVAHGYAANSLGDPTARLAGRLTLNPIPHIDLFGSILLPATLVLTHSPIFFGWAKPAPYNPHNLRNQRWGETIVALAGIATNFFLALVFGFIVRYGASFGFDQTALSFAASLMFSTAAYPYSQAWYHGALIPLLLLFLLTWASTRAGRARKAALGTVEPRHGRSASQVAANLGAAALILTVGSILFGDDAGNRLPALLALACLAEAAADTVSSELGQLLGRHPRSILSFRRVEPGTDGGVTLAGTIAGILAAGIVAGAGIALQLAQTGQSMPWFSFPVVLAAATFGLLFDSLLGATFEQRGWLNNDAVNFLSTLSAPVAAMAMLAIIGSRHPIY